MSLFERWILLPSDVGTFFFPDTVLVSPADMPGVFFF